MSTPSSSFIFYPPCTPFFINTLCLFLYIQHFLIIISFSFFLFPLSLPSFLNPDTHMHAFPNKESVRSPAFRLCTIEPYVPLRNAVKRKRLLIWNTCIQVASCGQRVADCRQRRSDSGRRRADNKKERVSTIRDSYSLLHYAVHRTNLHIKFFFLASFHLHLLY